MPKFFAHGTAVTIDGTAIGHLTSISGPDETLDEVETTDHDSEGTREFLPGLTDPGALTLEGRFDPTDAGQKALRTNMADKAVVEFVITYPEASGETGAATVTFNGFVTEFSPDGPFDDASTFSAGVKVTGAPVYDDAPAA